MTNGLQYHIDHMQERLEESFEKQRILLQIPVGSGRQRALAAAGYELTENQWEDIIKLRKCFSFGLVAYIYCRGFNKFEAEIGPATPLALNPRGGYFYNYALLLEGEGSDLVRLIKTIEQEALKLGKVAYDNFARDVKTSLQLIRSSDFKRLYKDTTFHPYGKED